MRAREEMQQATRPGGTLYVVATPLGNLADMSARAVATLREVEIVAAETVERCERLLSAMGGSKARVVSYRESNREEAAARLVAAMVAGERVALTTDAGTPGVSDPGNHLVAEAVKAGVEVVAVPGPSAVAAAVSLAHFAVAEFTFAGFAPRTGGKRRAWLKGFADEGRALVFFESPHRYREAMRDVVEVFGEGREVMVARELTKVHERVYRGAAATLCELPDFDSGADLLGEFTIVVAAGERADVVDSEAVFRDAVARIEGGEAVKQAAERVSAALGVPRREAYQQLLVLTAKK